MKTTAHTILSSATGFGLAALTIASFAVAGIAAPATVLGLSSLAVYALFEMACIEYTPVRRSVRTPVVSVRTSPRRAVVPAIVEFASSGTSRRAAA